LSLTPTVSSKGVGTVNLIATDLSEILEARGERDRAARDNQMKNEFLAMLAHELRNPLGAIRSAVGVLTSPDGTAGSAARSREVIERQVEHLSHLIDDLLDVERVASGKIRLERHSVDMARAVRQTVSSFSENAAIGRYIEVSTEPVWVDGDAVRLEQVLANIVTNAIKYSPPGGRIRVSLRTEGEEAVLDVEDAGFGIAPSLLPTIFDLFVQGERTLDRAQGGLGIGLTLVRRLVELHGGTVGAASDGVGRGSTFTVRLPRILTATTEAAVAPAPEATSRRVLIIEDSSDAREMFRMMLELAGHVVYEAEDGDRAMELVQTEQPEVAIIDIGLPGLDGYQVARRIRNLPNGPAMLLLALTGYGLPGDYERSAAAGFDHHLVKPVDSDALTRLLSATANGPTNAAV